MATQVERPPIKSDVDVRHAKPESAPYKRRDVEGRGMYLYVTPDGGRYWRLKYRMAGREKLLALGVYPDTSLASARKKRDAARELLANGTDPGKQRKEAKATARRNADNTFGAIAAEWYDKRKAKWSPAHAKAVKNRLDKELKPLAREPIAEIDAARLLEVLRGVEARGAHELVSKSRVIAGQVFRYAIASPGRPVKSDPTRDLRGQFEAREQKHYARLSENDLPDFLAKLEVYDGTLITKLAIRILALTFVRTGELRAAKWPEFNFSKQEWRIPAERMKGRREHIVPLSAQAIEALHELEALTGEGDYLLPNEHHPDKPMSENTILFALYRMGYRGRATGHGFRATASTILHEQNWDSNAIERQLAHKDPNEIRASYNHSGLLPTRRKMMQSWADFLDAKRAEADKGEADKGAPNKVVNIARKRA